MDETIDARCITCLSPDGMFPDLITARTIDGREKRYVPERTCQDCKWATHSYIGTCDSCMWNYPEISDNFEPKVVDE